VIPLPFIKPWRQISTDLNFPHFFGELGLKMLGRQQWQLLHVEKDEQVLQLRKHKLHNNTKIWRGFAFDLSELFCRKIFVLLLSLVYKPPVFTFFVRF
jgi:hypothetical protein